MIWRRFFKGFDLCFARTHAEHWVVFTSFFNFLTQTINLRGTERWLRIMFELAHKDHPIIHTSPEELLREMFLSWKEEHRFFFNYPSLRKGDKKLSIRHRGALSGCGERSQWKFCLQVSTLYICACFQRHTLLHLAKVNFTTIYFLSFLFFISCSSSCSLMHLSM